MTWCGGSADITFGLKKTKSMYARKHVCQTLQGHILSGMIWEKHTCICVGPFPICLSSSNIQDYPKPQMPWNLSLGISRISLDCTEGYQRLVWTTSSNGICTSMTKRSPRNKEMFTLLKSGWWTSSFTNHFCHDHQPKMSIIPRLYDFRLKFAQGILILHQKMTICLPLVLESLKTRLSCA